MSYRKGKGDIEMRQGYLKFHRVGNLTFIDQSHFPHAPAQKGLWAFPFPFFDESYVYHKYNDYLPKRLKENDETVIFGSDQWEEREQWIQEHGAKILKPKKFWYSGYLYSRLEGTGHPDGIDMDGDDELAGTLWTFMHTNEFYKKMKTGTDRGWEIYNGKKILTRYTVSHLEVFIPPNRGILREGINPPKR